MNGLFIRSLETKTPVEMIYLNEQGKLTQRIIRVLAIKKNHIKAYCYVKKQLRTFRYENMLSAGPVSSKTSA